MINAQEQKMIIATSQNHSFDLFNSLQVLTALLGYYRNIEDQVIANNELNALVTEQCGAQPLKYRFASARLEADPSEMYPGSLCIALRLTFLMLYQSADGYDMPQLFTVTSDDQGKLTGKLFVS
jgi:hypothetical protein